MSGMQKKRCSKLLLLVELFVLGGIFLLSGCASAPKTLNPTVTGPQVIVNPESISLGVAKLKDTQIVFEGSGFKPADYVFITLFGPNKTEANVGSGEVGPDGKFTAAVDMMTKVTKILKATVRGKYADGSYDRFIVITEPPIPAGTYTAKATSVSSNQTAETKLIINEPSIGDSLKDWLGKKMGKIIDERP